MYAVIRTGGKQYRVTAGDVIAVEKLTGESGGSVTFEDVLLIGDEKTQTVGAPTVDGASVAATILEQGFGDKIIVFKKKRRKGYRRTKGHRQPETVVKITDVLSKGGEPVAKKTVAKKADDAEVPKETKAKAADAPTKSAEKAPATKAKAAAAPKTDKPKSAAAKSKTAAAKSKMAAKPKTTAKKAPPKGAAKTKE